MAVREDGVVVDDKANDWGTRYIPDRNRSPVEHLGGMPNLIVNVPPDKPDKPLPVRDPNNLVVPPSNVPQERALQLLIEKVFSEKEQKELFTEENLSLKPPSGPDEKEKEAAAKADEEYAKRGGTPEDFPEKPSAKK